MRRRKKERKVKDGGIFYKDITAMHDRARHALLKAKSMEKHRWKIPVRIDGKTIILVDADADIDHAIINFKRRYKL